MSTWGLFYKIQTGEDLENFLDGEHIHTRRVWHLNSIGTETLMLRTQLPSFFSSFLNAVFLTVHTELSSKEGSISTKDFLFPQSKKRCTWSYCHAIPYTLVWNLSSTSLYNINRSFKYNQPPKCTIKKTGLTNYY